MDSQPCKEHDVWRFPSYTNHLFETCERCPRELGIVRRGRRVFTIGSGIPNNSIINLLMEMQTIKTHPKPEVLMNVRHVQVGIHLDV
jgi:hypothetical protein